MRLSLFALALAGTSAESKVCRDGFSPTNGLDNMHLKNVENHCKHPRHGVVCRRDDNSGHWYPPTGCTKESGFPFSAQPGTNKPCRVGCWDVLKVNNQGDKVTTTDTFNPFKTTAIRFQKNGKGQLRGHWFRVTEITAYDEMNKQVTPAGARTDNYHGAWRKASWAPELFDDNHNWGNDKAVHFQNYATIWFSGEVTIAKLRVIQAPCHGNKCSMGPNKDWMWLKYAGGASFHGTMPTPAPTPAPQVPTGWELLKVNTQGNSKDVRDNFTPFQTKAIRVQSNYPGVALKQGWFRVAEIDAYGTDGKQIVPVSARTDNWHGAWRKSAWAPELYDDSTRWGNDHAVHFKKHATLNFGKVVTIKQLRFVQHPHRNANQIEWMWLKEKLAPVHCQGNWGACSKTCAGGSQNYVITGTAMYGGDACPFTADESRECNSDVECPEIIDLEMSVEETVESFTEDKQEELKKNVAQNLGVDASQITITIGAKPNAISSRRLSEALLITITVSVLPSEATEKIEVLESPTFAEATGVTFVQFKPSAGSSLCATCKWNGHHIQVIHYINAQKSGEKGLQHKCYHMDGKCTCKCNRIAF